MRQFLAAVLNVRSPVLGPDHNLSDAYSTYRLLGELAHRDAFKIAGLGYSTDEIARSSEEAIVEAMATLDIASSRLPDSNNRAQAFPPAVFQLQAYKLVFVHLPKVPSHEKILSTISLPNSTLVVALRSYVPTLERDLNTSCVPYNPGPAINDVDLLGFVQARTQRIDALAGIAVNAMLRDDTVDKGLWIYIEPTRVLNLFTTWLGEVIAIRNDPDGRIQLHRYDFNSYTLVRVSGLRLCVQSLDTLANFDEILSIEELQDESWELPVLKTYLPTLEDKLRDMVPNCIIEPDYDPTEPNKGEVKELGYKIAKNVKTKLFRERVKRMKRESWPKAGAFYSDLAICIEKEMAAQDDDEKEWDALENKEQGEEEMVGASIDACWVVV